MQIIYVENTADDPSRRKPDITKIKTTLGWEPKIPLREGLPRMVQDFKKCGGIESWGLRCVGVHVGVGTRM